MQGKLIIFSAPSGSGKSTIINYLLQQNLNLAFSISATSRAPRGNRKERRNLLDRTYKRIYKNCTTKQGKPEKLYRKSSN